MSRMLKRVALDFDWPLNKVWEGYINPYGGKRQNCVPCKGTGLIEVARRWSEMFFGFKDETFEPGMTRSVPFDGADLYIMDIIRQKVERNLQSWLNTYGTQGIEEVIRREALRMCAIWNRSWSHHLSQNDVRALFEEGRLTDFGETCPQARDVNRWSLVGMAHDAINEHICLEARMRRMGYEDYYCAACAGEADIWPNPEDEAGYENWVSEEPPGGEGFQVWETVSEGSPISPVFEQGVALLYWLVREGYSRSAAERFMEVGWAPSMIVSINASGEMTMRRNIEALG